MKRQREKKTFIQNNLVFAIRVTVTHVLIMVTHIMPFQMKVLENVNLIVPFLTDDEIISIIISISLLWALLFSIYCLSLSQACLLVIHVNPVKYN